MRVVSAFFWGGGSSGDSLSSDLFVVPGLGSIILSRPVCVMHLHHRIPSQQLLRLMLLLRVLSLAILSSNGARL